MPPVFVDQREIHTGDQWPEVLKGALRQSRVLVAILTPSYFHSEWCMSEWASFEAREQRVGQNLIVPICISNYPYVESKCGGQRQIFNFCRLNEHATNEETRPDAFTRMQKAIIQNVASEVARKIRSAPTYEDWPLVGLAAEPPPTVQLLGFGNAA